MENLFTDAELTELKYGAVAWSIFILYFLPTIIAAFRRHHSFFSIFIINLFLGWTFFGWVGSLASAVAEKRETYPKNKPSTIHQLDVLSRLKEKGHLSRKEFDKQKRKLLG